MSGKVGNLVFFVYKGKQVVRIYSTACKGKSKLVEKAMSGVITSGEVSQLNHRIIFGLLDWLYRKKLKPVVSGCWDKICTRKRLQMTGRNLFMSYNISIIYDSISNVRELISSRNAPDFTELLITKGDLWAPYNIKSISYSPFSGVLKLFWDSSIFRDAKSEDEAHIVILYWEPTDILSPKPWTTLKFWYNSGRRVDGCSTLDIGKRLTPKWLTVFLFFKNSNQYSRSIGARLTAKR
ncbi:hypothetical protein KAW65_07795 [candidate division WOR-3 bacterium]|nr:hypothetical protein [candidate division WOR-3 bacterium]